MAAVRKRIPKEQRKAEILDAAVKVFAEKGYRNASITDINEAAGIARVGLGPGMGDQAEGQRVPHARDRRKGRIAQNLVPIAGHEGHPIGFEHIQGVLDLTQSGVHMGHGLVAP